MANLCQQIIKSPLTFLYPLLIILSQCWQCSYFMIKYRSINYHTIVFITCKSCANIHRPNWLSKIGIPQLMICRDVITPDLPNVKYQLFCNLTHCNNNIEQDTIQIQSCQMYVSSNYYACMYQSRESMLEFDFKMKWLQFFIMFYYSYAVNSLHRKHFVQIHAVNAPCWLVRKIRSAFFFWLLLKFSFFHQEEILFLV